jgi:hypothetical protein
VLAYTVWDTPAKECCDERRDRGCDDKPSGCRQGYPCCDDDDEDG